MINKLYSIIRKHEIKWILIFSLIYIIGFIPSHFLNGNIQSGDDTSYLSHAFTIALDFDLDYSNEITRRFNRYGNIAAHPIGSGILASPFVALFSIIDRLSKHPIIKDHSKYMYSWSFFGFLFAVNFYFLAGVFLYWRSLKLFYLNYGFGINFIFILSTGILYYVLGRFTMCHGFEFFILALTVWCSIKLFKKIKKSNKYYIWIIIIAAVTIANLWIRISNINTVLIPYIIILALGNKLNEDRISLAKTFFILSIFLILYYIPLAVFNLYYFKGLYPNPLVMYGTDSMKGLELSFGAKLIKLMNLIPNIGLLLLSSEFGLIYTYPILIFGFVAFIIKTIDNFKSNRNKYELLLAFLVFIYVAFSTAIVLFWQTTGSDYGYRYLYPLMPIAMIGSCIFMEYNEVKNYHRFNLLKLNRKIVKYLFIFLCFVGIMSQMFYKTTPQLFPKSQINVYGVKHLASAKGYQINLIKEILKPKTWILFIGKSYMGMLSFRYVSKTKLIEIVPIEFRNKYVTRFIHIPRAVYFQTITLFLLWVLYGYFISLQIKKKEN